MKQRARISSLSRKQIRGISRKQAERLKRYSGLVKEWKARPENARCAVPGCNRRTDDNHHSRGRLGELLFDERFWIPVCRPHHNRIGQFPIWARGAGLICEKGDWNTKPKEA